MMRKQESKSGIVSNRLVQGFKRALGTLVAGGIACLAAAVPSHASPIDLGAAGNFSVLELGSANSTATLSITGPSGVSGNVGLAGSTTGSITGSSILGGGVYLNTPGAFKNSSSGAVGPTTVTDLGAAVHDALAASAYAASLTPTHTFADLTGPLTLTGNGSLNVIDIHSIDFTGAGDVLTLTGTATDRFVINLTGNFTLTHQLSGVQVAGGVLASNVLFNILGTGSAVSFSGMPTVDGSFLAPDRQIHLDPGIIHGFLIAGDSIAITSGGQVFTPHTAVPEPSVLALGAIGAGAGLLRRRTRHANDER